MLEMIKSALWKGPRAVRRWWYVDIKGYRTDTDGELSRLNDGIYSVHQYFYGLEFHGRNKRIPKSFYNCTFVDCSFEALRLQFVGCTLRRTRVFRCTLAKDTANDFDRFSRPRECDGYV